MVWLPAQWWGFLPILKGSRPKICAVIWCRRYAVYCLWMCKAQHAIPEGLTRCVLFDSPPFHATTLFDLVHGFLLKELLFDSFGMASQPVTRIPSIDFPGER